MALKRGVDAFERLLILAEFGDSGQAGRVARFIAATYNARLYTFDLFALRLVDEATSDDILACLDALRGSQVDLYRQVPHGEQRVRSLIDAWGFNDG